MAPRSMRAGSSIVPPVFRDPDQFRAPPPAGARHMAGGEGGVGRAPLAVVAWLRSIWNLIQGKDRWAELAESLSSLEHGRIEEPIFISRDGHAYVVNRGDRNPMLLNDEVLPVGVEIPLLPGDRVSIGGHFYIVKNSDGSVPALEASGEKSSNIVVEGAHLMRGDLQESFVDGVEKTKELKGIDGIEIVRDDEGVLWIVDRRPRDPLWDDRLIEGEEEGYARRISLTTPLHVNDAKVEANRPFHLQHGDVIKVDYTRGIVRLDALLFKRMPAWTRRVVEHLSLRGDVPAMAKALSETPYGIRLSDDIRDVLAAKRPLVALPEIYGVRDGVIRFMARKIDEWKALGINVGGMHPIMPDIRSPIEVEFWTYQETVRLRKGIDEAKDLEGLAAVVAGTRLERIEYRKAHLVADRILEIGRQGGGDVQSLPRVVRQRVRDLLDEGIGTGLSGLEARSGGVGRKDRSSVRVTRLMRGLDDEKFALYEEVESGEPYKNTHKVYTPREMRELVYQVLERGKFVEILPRGKGIQGVRERILAFMGRTVGRAEGIYPKEMALCRNPFNGEPVDREDVPARYRLAMMLLNRDAGRPIFGSPTDAETEKLIGTLNPLFSDRFTRYSDIQKRLRKALEEGDRSDWRGVEKFLSSARAEEKASVLEAYFGNSQHRDVKSLELAFRIASLFGHLGVYREVGVTIEVRDGHIYPSLTLGDMNSVSPEESNRYFVLHTHPEMYVNSRGEVMGRIDRGDDHLDGATVALDASRVHVKRSTRNIMFSRKDIDSIMRSAARYAQWVKIPSLIFDPVAQIFKEWVLHPFGGSQMLVKMDGVRPSEIVIRYALNESRAILNEKYRDQIAKLEKYVEENWHRWGNEPIAIRFERFGSYDEFLRTIPFSLKPDFPK